MTSQTLLMSLSLLIIPNSKSWYLHRYRQWSYRNHLLHFHHLDFSVWPRHVWAPLGAYACTAVCTIVKITLGVVTSIETNEAEQAQNARLFWKWTEVNYLLHTNEQQNQWRSQPKNFGGGQNVWFSANNTILFGKTPLKARNDYIF